MPEPLLPKEIEALAEEFRKLRRAVESANSFKKTMLRSLLSGAATAIGASIIATLLILSLISIVRSIGLSEWFESSGLQTLLERATGH
jgi:hypothetical protein